MYARQPACSGIVERCRRGRPSTDLLIYWTRPRPPRMQGILGAEPYLAIPRSGLAFEKVITEQQLDFDTC